MSVEVPPRSERGYVAEFRNPWRGVPGLALAIRICGPELAAAFKRVPDEYVAAMSIRDTRREIRLVVCPCGAQTRVGEAIVECSGGCGRWFAADEMAAWSVRLPEQEA